MKEKIQLSTETKFEPRLVGFNDISSKDRMLLGQLGDEELGSHPRNFQDTDTYNLWLFQKCKLKQRSKTTYKQLKKKLLFYLVLGQFCLTLY